MTGAFPARKKNMENRIVKIVPRMRVVIPVQRSAGAIIRPDRRTIETINPNRNSTIPSIHKMKKVIFVPDHVAIFLFYIII
jgi:hypothetical protein